jgi:hypothetical protein
MNTRESENHLPISRSARFQKLTFGVQKAKLLSVCQTRFNKIDDNNDVSFTLDQYV